ncbi:MAG: hypothetical protein EKK42_20280 [Pseudonocardiaceae bacterium]|nr:MAG: hypothetical protein EKK42_20280 [Pseudonocardiaceae bacterium]
MKSGRAAFQQLHEHEYDLPQYLAEQGLQGVRNQCALCPIARYLLRNTDAVDVEVSHTYTTLIYAGEKREELDNPDFVADFIEDFDAQRFPQLELSSCKR